MSRNSQSHFAVNPTNIDMSRSRFDRPFSHKTTFNVGQIIPFYVDEVLPGDTFDVETSRVVRMQSLITPVMDNIYLDMYYFFVPNRIVWSHWKQFMGENTESAWIPKTEYEVPQITAPSESGFAVGTIADYLGVPTGVPNLSVNALPFRAYALICNEWFRDENLSDPLNIPVDDATVAGVNTGTFVTDVAKGGLPYTAAKYHDYFTSALPAPQKGPDVLIPSNTSGTYPVVTKDETIPNLPTFGMQVYGNVSAYSTWKGVGSRDLFNNSKGITADGEVVESFSTIGPESGSIAPSNLWVETSGGLGATINQLRMAFQIQKLYEKDARGGTRYIEVLKSHFGVTSPDARLQRPEYLGGNRVPININQVLQTSGTVEGNTPQGTPVGQSLTTDTHHDFKKSFVEHGFVIGVMVARYRHTYQQGLERFWNRHSRLDFYWPVFANIGEQAILNKEIYAQGTDEDEEVFGYQEAWADYRYKPDRVSAEMRSAYAQSLDVWHLADDYDKLPSLSDSWIREDPSNVDRVLAVQSNTSAQFFADIFVMNRTTRPMPMYSIPGLIDHH
ncbi:MAG: major capsid protein [Candidatus Pseudoscilispira sp.]|nr:major capsid protein [Candidatus Pseudoscilispira sp.]